MELEEYIQSALDAAKITRIQFEMLSYKRQNELQNKKSHKYDHEIIYIYEELYCVYRICIYLL